MARIDAFLKLGLAQGCSDIHLAVGIPPMLRLHGDLMPIKFRDLGSAELEDYVYEVLTEAQRERFESGSDLDFSYVSGDNGRRGLFHLEFVRIAGRNHLFGQAMRREQDSRRPVKRPASRFR